jgi:hypothetical protein
MLSVDPVAIELIGERRREMMAEAERSRLAEQLPHRESGLRRGLATACYRLANWLDAPPGYVQIPEAGPEDWAAPWASV